MNGPPPFEQFFAFRRFQPTLAFTPNGKTLLFSSNISGQFNLWSVDVAGGWPEQLTTYTDRTVRSIAVRDDGAIAFSADCDGDEFHQLFALPADAQWPEQWTDAPQVQHFIADQPWSPDGKRFLYAANARKPTDMELFVRDESGGSRAIFGAGMYAFPGRWSPDGRSVLAIEFRSNSDVSIHLVDVDSGESRELTPHDEPAKYVAGGWKPDGSGFYLLTDAEREFTGLAFFDLAAGRYEWLETPDADIDEATLSSDGRYLAWVENDRGWARLCVRDTESGELLPEAELPPGCTFVLGSAPTFSPDGTQLALIWEQPRRPPDVYLVQVADGSARRITQSKIGRLRAEELVEPELTSYPTFDGRDIPLWLYRPQRDDETLPVVVSIHGGPEAQDRPTYRPVFQYLLSRGIAVVAPNIRGSTGYGKSYQRLIYHDWGGADLEDWRCLAEWLRAQEWVDAERIGVIGGSYGGFASLTCVTRLPEYWAVAVDIVGPSNLVTFSRAVPPTWRRFMTELLGDPDTEEDFLIERSPLTYVENVRAPLLVIQGANDPRVVKAESDQLVERLRELGRDVEYEVFEDEGHGFTRYANEVRAYRLTADWVEQHLVRAPVAAAVT